MVESVPVVAVLSVALRDREAYGTLLALLWKLATKFESTLDANKHVQVIG